MLITVNHIDVYTQSHYHFIYNEKLDCQFKLHCTSCVRCEKTRCISYASQLMTWRNINIYIILYIYNFIYIGVILTYLTCTEYTLSLKKLTTQKLYSQIMSMHFLFSSLKHLNYGQISIAKLWGHQSQHFELIGF